MGTTLTGTTPQDTYDSLIKVTDNGPLSGTAKYLSDGLGNDSKLALSTGNIGIGTTSPADSLDILNTSTTAAIRLAGTAAGSKVYRLTSAIIGASNTGFAIRNETDTRNELSIDGSGFVGIGTSSAAAKLHVSSSADVEVKVNSSAGAYTSKLTLNAAGGGASVIDANGGTQPRLIFANNGTTIASITNGGLCFNADTAAANALDDYEEGTFTATLTPETSGSITGSATYTTWTYTKIGRQVTINGVFVVSAVSSPVGNFIKLGGLPFAVLAVNGAYGSFSTMFTDASAGSAKSSLPSWHSIAVSEIWMSIDASTIAANDEFYVTATYFV